MTINQTATGRFVDGKEIISVELKNKNKTSVKILNYGAIISSFEVLNAAKEKQDIVLGFDDIDGYLSDAYIQNGVYLGAVIGRYTNRIKNGSFELDNVQYSVTKNANGNTLHGGKNGFDKKVWDLVDLDEESNSVTFEYESKDGEEGFPGNVWISLSFELTDNDELILSYEAESDRSTPLNLTHHDYFNLSPAVTNVSEHTHQMFASNYLEKDESFAATGKLIDVRGTEMDFLKSRAIGDGWDAEQGYDHSFVLDKEYGELTLASVTSNKKSGLKLSVYTTEPVAHFYTGKYLNVDGAKHGKHYGEFDGFCIETHHHPNAVNVPGFPSTILNSGELYNQTTIFKVSLGDSENHQI